MSQSSDSSTRALATLVTALGITIGATPATLHAQAPAAAPAREAVQSKGTTKDAVQMKVGTPAKDAVQKKEKAQSDGDEDGPTVQGRKSPAAEKAAVQMKVGTSAKAPSAAPAKPF